ncbi:ATP synthase subunit delta', mitochondrial-like [Salvia miltiorrhiza]|uniref:ATP synthase subunit delta', mitochondrial-like n=1 Tax=Salvia miltiorrhiza TaxID=226208 RepID=UPI0025AC5822|nr:ATP synthase subunit delta', mitochondrial-like [Salvia miltiorrhiza]
MFRRGAARLLLHRRRLSTTDVRTVPAADDLFAAAWRRIAPNVDLPETPLAFRQPSTTSAASKLTINFNSRYSSRFSNKQVDMVVAPGVAGQIGILPGHVASISELKPGLLSIHEDGEVMKYFISSGFAFVHSNSVIEIFAVEAVTIKQIDPASVQKGLAEFTQKLSMASTDAEKAEAQIALDVLTSLDSSLAG